MVPSFVKESKAREPLSRVQRLDKSQPPQPEFRNGKERTRQLRACRPWKKILPHSAFLWYISPRYLRLRPFQFGSWRKYVFKRCGEDADRHTSQTRILLALTSVDRRRNKTLTFIGFVRRKRFGDRVTENRSQRRL